VVNSLGAPVSSQRPGEIPGPLRRDEPPPAAAPGSLHQIFGEGAHDRIALLGRGIGNVLKAKH